MQIQKTMKKATQSNNDREKLQDVEIEEQILIGKEQINIDLIDDLTKQNIVAEILEDFQKRQQQRRQYELKWLLNMNFLNGNQHSYISARGEIEKLDNNYSWEKKEVFNHIAPIIETRLSKLNRVRPMMSVRSATSDDEDVQTAKLSTKILRGAINRYGVSQVINEVTRWSEVCGTAFYKVMWSESEGQVVGRKSNTNEDIFEGDVKLHAVPPFEVYPENNSISAIEDQHSIIHAKAMSVKDVFNMWGIRVDGKNFNVFTLDNLTSLNVSGGNNQSASCQEQSTIVIEKYVKPSKDFPQGRLAIVAGDKLVYLGCLPYVNNFDMKKAYPFVKQNSIAVAGSFWGISVIERLIPIQKAYNAVKNRKYEFLNRISMGMLTVEDGSVDTDNLEIEGLSPGKVIVYRQGSTPPRVMENFSVPIDFFREEERLLNEFILISGVSELMRNSAVYSQNISGVALERLIEQDDTRLLITVDYVRNAIKKVAKMILSLFKQYAKNTRLMRISGDCGDVEVVSFNSNSITSDDVVFDTENEITETTAQRRTMAFDLLKSGLLADENGKISDRMRAKMLEILGFGSWENVQDLSTIHISMAENENNKLLEKIFEPNEIDDNEIHIAEHTKFVIAKNLQGKTDEKVKQNFYEHIKMHKTLLVNSTNAVLKSQNMQN